MEATFQNDNWDTNKAAKRKQKEEADNIRYVVQLDKRWKEAHAKRVSAVESELLKASPGAAYGEKLLVNLISHDFALCEILGEAEIQLARRISTLIDKVNFNRKVTST